jgi:predicted nucleic acid-binding protein
VVAQASLIAAAYYQNHQPVPLRTLDALHLATAMLLKCRRIVTADERMRAAATLLKLATV